MQLFSMPRPRRAGAGGAPAHLDAQVMPRVLLAVALLGRLATGVHVNAAEASEDRAFAALLSEQTASTAALLKAKASPFNGAAFLRPQGLSSIPSQYADGQDTNLMTFRLLPNKLNTKDASSCSMGNQAGMDACLNNKDRECMWTKVESANPLIAIQESFSYCLPCVIDDTPIPCWNIGAQIGGYFNVMDCQMRCPHQQRLIQPEYGCSDETGFITQSQCFDRGARSQSKCMFMAYTMEDGTQKSVCGPCYVEGTGGYGCPDTGGAGPEAGSTLNTCLSQCFVLCIGPPNCAPTVAPPPPPPPPSPGVMVTNEPDEQKMLLAPVPKAMPTVSPYAFAMAAQKAAEKAGWQIGTPIPPMQYHPVIIYRAPSDYLYTPAPNGGIVSSLAYPAPPGLLQVDSGAAVTPSPTAHQEEHEVALVERGTQHEAAPQVTKLRTTRLRKWGN